MRENRWLRELGVHDKHATCRVRAFGAGPSVAGALACADGFQVSEASAMASTCKAVRLFCMRASLYGTPSLFMSRQ